MSSAPVPGRDEPGVRAVAKSPEEEEEGGEMKVTIGSFRLDLKSGDVTAKRLGSSSPNARRCARRSQPRLHASPACPNRNSSPPTGAMS